MRSVLNPTGRLTFCTAASHSGAPSQAVTLEAAFIPAGSRRAPWAESCAGVLQVSVEVRVKLGDSVIP